MRYRNVITRVCRDGCISLRDGTCFLHGCELKKIILSGNTYYLIDDKCVYKKNRKVDDDKCKLPLEDFSEWMEKNKHEKKI